MSCGTRSAALESKLYWKKLAQPAICWDSLMCRTNPHLAASSAAIMTKSRSWLFDELVLPNEVVRKWDGS